MCHTLLEIPKKRANINHRLLFMKVVNVSLSARFGEASRVLSACVSSSPLRHESAQNLGEIIPLSLSFALSLS